MGLSATPFWNQRKRKERKKERKKDNEAVNKI
jgi:hypothetical protein